MLAIQIEYSRHETKDVIALCKDKEVGKVTSNIGESDIFGGNVGSVVVSNGASLGGEDQGSVINSTEVQRTRGLNFIGSYGSYLAR